MIVEEFEKLFHEEEDINWDGDNTFQGLLIIAKYINPNDSIIIVAAKHDVVCSVEVKELCDAGITKEDVIALRKLNWSIENEHYLMCFV